MFILKIIVVILSIFILSIWGNFIVERVKEGIQLKADYEKGQYIFGIIDEAYSKIDEITNSNNYSVIEESTSISEDLQCVYNYSKYETYYKDGYIKEVNTSDSGELKETDWNNSCYSDYSVITKDKIFDIQLHDEYDYGYIGTIWGTNENKGNILAPYHKEDVLEYKDYEIKEENIDGKDYYIISNSANRDDNIYDTEIWINKDNMQLFKIVGEKRGCNKVERKFNFSVNNVKDEDVRVKFLGANEKIQELDRLFEKLKNGEFGDGYAEVAKWNHSIESKIIFDNLAKPEKKVILAKEASDIAMNKHEMGGGGHSYYGIIFDQNGDAYYAYRQSKMEDIKNVFVQNIFVSIFGDTVKTNNIDMELYNGDMVIL